MSIFDIIKDIIKDKKGNLYLDIDFEKEFNVYLLARFLSMRKELIPYANYLNIYGTILNKESLYKYLIQSIPKTNNYFIKYLKKKKE